MLVATPGVLAYYKYHRTRNGTNLLAIGIHTLEVLRVYIYCMAMLLPRRLEKKCSQSPLFRGGLGMFEYNRIMISRRFLDRKEKEDVRNDYHGVIKNQAVAAAAREQKSRSSNDHG